MKVKEYDSITAYHYAAYRPPLHSTILQQLLGSTKHYKSGLDIGCGTGHSAIALTQFCDHVTGLEPSLSMLQNAISNPHVQYIHFSNKNLPFENCLFDLISFAGSLYYCKSQALLNELSRVSKKGAVVLIYDFQVEISEILIRLGIPKDLLESNYNHAENFSGLNTKDFKLISTQKNELNCSISPKELMHLILSVKPFYQFLKLSSKNQDLELKTFEILQGLSGNDNFRLPTNYYSSIYQVL